VVTTRPTGPIVVGPDRHRDIRTSGRGVPTNEPSSCSFGRAANGVTGVKHRGHQPTSPESLAPQARHTLANGMSEVSGAGVQRLTG
jgi:hypothetical protein